MHLGTDDTSALRIRSPCRRDGQRRILCSASHLPFSYLVERVDREEHYQDHKEEVHGCY